MLSDHEFLGPLRQNTHLHLLQNPNYFGTLENSETSGNYESVYQLGNNQSFYEQLGCIGYNPLTKKLGVVIIVKQAGGYGGSACNGGSREYVRFFLDYNNSGSWVDEGLAQVGVYDHSSGDDLCYYAEITLTPDKASCCYQTAVLPKVRTILSWNTIPTAGNPNYNYVWGDKKESHIQIAPNKNFWCFLTSDLLKSKLTENLAFEMMKPAITENLSKEVNEYLKQIVPTSIEPASIPELLKEYSSCDQGRVLYDSIQMAATNSSINTTQLQYSFPNINISEVIDSILSLKYNTSYEEVHCVSLNKDLSVLHASVEVKQKQGYLGKLCSAGSKEYVAFYMDFGTGWEYMGTSSATVHDIDTMPNGGLWYDVALNVNLDAHREAWCKAGVAKLRAILSWNTPPTPNDPNYHANWGDRAECNVEIKPLPKGVKPGDVVAVIEKVGGMVVTDINNATGLATTSLGSASLGGAYLSPFYGQIKIVGRIFNAAAGTKYRFLVSTPTSSEHPLLQDQSIQTDTLGFISLPITLTADSDGWMTYYATSPNVAIVGDQIGIFYPSVEGMYSIRIEMKDAANIITTGNSVNFLVNLKAPDVAINITSGGGDCADFTVGDSLTGTYSMYDAHAGSFSVYVTPNKGAKVGIDGHIPVNTSDGLSYPGGGLPATGKSGTFSINTAGVPRCGYNVWITAYDRTIVNSAYIGLQNQDVQGFCLREAAVQ